MKNKRGLLFLCVTSVSVAVAGFFFGSQAMPKVGANDEPSISCAEIVYGNEIPDIASNETSGYTVYTTSGLPSFKVSSEGYVAKDSLRKNDAIKLGSGKNYGALNFVFSSKIVISRAIVYACSYSSKADYSDTIITVSTDVDLDGDFASMKGYEAPDISGSSKDGMLLSGFDADAGVAASSLKVSCNSGAPIYFCKIVLALSSNQPPVSSSSEMSSSDISSASSSSSPSSSNTNTTISSGISTNTSQYWDDIGGGSFIDNSPSVSYRTVANKSKDGKSVELFGVAELNGNYSLTITRTLYKDQWYVDSEDVAAFYNGFGVLPENYVHYENKRYHGHDTSKSAKAETYNTYSTKGRLFTEYNLKTGYVTCMPDDLRIDDPEFHYIEVDLGTTSEYASGTSFNRGAGRLVVFPFGAIHNGNDPFIVQTLDHYGHFREFANFYGGWGPNFIGEKSTVPNDPYQALTTVVASFN